MTNASVKFSHDLEGDIGLDGINQIFAYVPLSLPQIECTLLMTQKSSTDYFDQYIENNENFMFHNSIAR